MSSSDIDHGIGLAYVVAVRDVRYHSVACLTFLVWHCLLTFDKDLQYIWTMHNRNPLKWVYFFLRYVVILACVMHNWLIEPLTDGNNPLMFCNMWFAYVLVFTQILATLLELILAARIFALYNRSRRIAFVLSGLMLMEFAGTLRSLWLQKGLVFHQTCLLLQVTESGRNQSILGFIVHCVLIGLMLFKYFLTFRAGWNNTPLVLLVVRDGSTMYATILLILVSVLIICDMENERGVAVFFWVVSLLSISGCHMILSMERLARREISIDLPHPIFTSQLTIGTINSSRWDSSTPALSQ